MGKKYLDSEDFMMDLMAIDAYGFVGKANAVNSDDKFTPDECLFTAANTARYMSDKLEEESVRYPEKKKRYGALVKDLRRRDEHYRSFMKEKEEYPKEKVLALKSNKKVKQKSKQIKTKPVARKKSTFSKKTKKNNKK